MSTRFYSGQKDYIPQLNSMDQAFQDAMAYLTGSTVNPLPLGTATPGTVSKYAREDHVHPSTGTTQSVGNNTTQYATTAFVHQALGNTLSKTMTNADVTLSATEALYAFIKVSGALTANVNLIVPAASRAFLVNNQTTGAFTLTVKTAAGTGVTVKQGQNRFVYCDGTNVLATDTDMSGISIDGMTGGTINGSIVTQVLTATTNLAVSESGTTVNAATASAVSIGGIVSGSRYIQSWNSKPLALNPSGNNVMVGTTTDNGTDKLQVSGTALVGNTLKISNGSGSSNGNLELTGWNGGAASTARIFANFNGGLSIQSADSITRFTRSSDGTEIARIASTGYIGAENTYISADTASPPRVGIVKKSGMGPSFAAQNGNSIIFGHVDFGNIGTGTFTERAQISPNGALLINTTAEVGTNKLVVNGTAQFNSTVNMIAPNAGLEMGAIGSANTPYIDFHSSASSNDYDVRMVASNGTTSNGNGDLTINAANVATTGAMSTTGNLTVGGNLTVNGTTTTVNSTTVTVDDVVLTLGGDTAPTSNDGKDRGIEFRYHNGTGPTAGFFGWDNSLGKYVFMHGVTGVSEVFSGTKSTIVANLEGNVTGNLTGNVTGDVTGNLIGFQTNTNLGKVGNVGFNLTNTAAGWANLPVGFASMMDYNITTAGGAPENNYGYFLKVANRDTGGGWGGIWVGYGANDTYVGTAGDSTMFPVWYKVFTSRTTIPVANGGTGQTSYVIGDILYANTTSTLARLADIATGNVLLSGGVGVAPSYGKVGLTTHVSGVLPIANGGTNSTATPTAGGVGYGNGSAHAYTAAGTAKQVLQSNGAGAPTFNTLDSTYLSDWGSANVALNGGVSIDKSNVDANTVKTTGFYRGANMPNLPDTSWWYLTVEAHDANWLKQTITSFGDGPTYPAGTTFVRTATYIGNVAAWTAWMSLGGGATGGGSNKVFVENDINVTSNYTITSGKNAMSAGPITIATGVTVTIPTGSVWTIV
jgi:hypothetical protein